MIDEQTLLLIILTLSLLIVFYVLYLISFKPRRFIRNAKELKQYYDDIMREDINYDNYTDEGMN